MADVTIQIHYITAGLSGGGLYETGQYIHVIADGSNIRAELRTSGEVGGGSLIGTPSGGPNFDGPPSNIYVSSGSFLDPRYCVGDDQVYYTVKTIWPYADYNLLLDAPACVVIVCDLEITGYTVTNESGPGEGDGEIALTAISSNGNYKFSLVEDFAYADGQDSPITGLTTGNYTIYAVDESGCRDEILVFVPVNFDYAVRWRCDYGNVFPRGYYSRIDIEEREFTGDLEEICGGGDPFILDYRPSDDSQLVPSVASMQFLVNTDAKFDDIRTGNDRQFRVRKYKGPDVGSLTLEWTGFISPEFYTEPYLNEPYIINLEAYDGLGELKNKPFLTESGAEYFGDMSLIQIISECLKKLPLEINIRSCVNVFEENHDTDPEDDPLAQTYKSTQNYRGMNCDQVITSIIKPLIQSELFQSFGVWWIRTKEQSADTNLVYREFDIDATYVTNSTLAARKSLVLNTGTNGLKFIERSQVLGYSRPYGKFLITHDLGKDNNVIDSGGFEVKDINPATEFFRDWTLFPAQVNLTYGLEYVRNGQSAGAFFLQFSSGSGNQADNILMSSSFPFVFASFADADTRFKLKFQAYVSPAYQINWARVGWKFRMTDTDTGDFYDWFPPVALTGIAPDANEALINDLYITNFNSWQTHEFYGFRHPAGIDVTNLSISISFYLHNHTNRDYQSLAGLKAQVTLNTLEQGKRVYATFGGSAPTLGYELQRNTDTADDFNVVRPDDYNAGSNPYQWIKISEYNLAGTVPLISRVMIDNLEVSVFTIGFTPGIAGSFLIDPPETNTYEQEVTDDNESTFDVEVTSGDAPDIVGTEYIYNGYFKLSDGSLTSRWARSGVTESLPLLSIYLLHLISQGSSSLRKLSGSGIGDVQLGFINSLEDVRDSVKYKFKRLSLSDKQGQYTFESEQILVGEGGESPPETMYRVDHEGNIRSTNAGDLRVYAE